MCNRHVQVHSIHNVEHCVQEYIVHMIEFGYVIVSNFGPEPIMLHRLRDVQAVGKPNDKVTEV